MNVNDIEEIYKNITRITILNSKSTYYPLRYAFQKRGIRYDQGTDWVLELKLLPEDIEYPADVKDADAGPLLSYKIAFTVNNQAGITQDKLLPWQGRKVIALLHYATGYIIIGCNEMPMRLTLSDQNSSNPANTNGFIIECAGNALVPKVIR